MKNSFAHVKNALRTGVGIGVLTLTTLLLLAALLSVGTTRSEQRSIAALSSTSPTPVGDVVVSRDDFGSWKYTAMRGARGIHAIINYDASSAQALHNYAAANQALAEQVASNGGEARINITFRSYVQPDHFRSWATAKGLRVERCELRGIDTNGIDTTIYLTLRENETDPLPQGLVDSGLKGLSALRGV